MPDRSDELLGMFRGEAGERLDRMVATLLSLERRDPPADALDSLFRDAHSIKGSAGMLGLDDAYTVAHAIEDVLAEGRRSGALPAALIEPLLRASDALRRAVEGEPEGVEAALGEIASAARRHAAGRDKHVGPSRAVPEAPEDQPAQSHGVTMRVSADRVDRLLETTGEVVLQQRRLQHALRAGGQGSGPDRDLADASDALLRELQDSVLDLRTVPLSTLTGPLPRAVRDLAASEGKEVELVVQRADTQLDRVVLEGVREAITHLLRNAVAHGVEPPEERAAAGKPRTGRVVLRAEPQGDRVSVEVEDDGRGVAPELRDQARDRPLVEVLAAAGVSTADAVTELSGRGVGLDAVRSAVSAVGGSVDVQSEPGRGTRVAMVLPVTLAVLQVLLAERSGAVFGLPFAGVVAGLAVEGELSLQGRASLDFRGEAVPLADLAELLGGPPAELRRPAPAVVLASGGRRAAVACDRLLGEEEVVVKSFGPLLAGVRGYLGGAVLGDGRVALVVDPSDVVAAAAQAAPRARPAAGEPVAPAVLVVDDQFTVRELQRSILEAAGYRVETARDGREALEALSGSAPVDAVVTDIEMPVMDGLELLESIRRDPRRATLPVVVVTSRGSQEDERRGLEAGADAYIAKERFDQQTLLDTVERLVGR